MQYHYSKKLLILTLFILLLVNFNPRLNSNSLGGDKRENIEILEAILDITTQEKPEETEITPRAPKDWTVMIYCDADNNLEDAGYDDLSECESATSGKDNSNVNVVMYLDTYGPAYMYEIYNGNSYYALSSLPSEPNMGEASTLEDFVEFCNTTYPAEHTALILWDHGNGILGACWDESSDDDHLNYYEMRTALTGYHFDIIAFDACLMAMSETFYELSEYCDIFVASEETIPWDGYPYNDIIDYITDTPSSTPEQFATTMVNDYVNDYAGEGDVTLSAADTTYAEPLKDAIHNLAVELLASPDQSSSPVARYQSKSYYEPSYVDLIDYVSKLILNTNESILDEAATWVLNNATSAIIANNHDDAGNSNGLSIFFPEDEYYSIYDGLLVAQETSWDEYLQTYQPFDPDDDEKPEIVETYWVADGVMNPATITTEQALDVYFRIIDDYGVALDYVGVYFKDYILPHYVDANLEPGNGTTDGWWKGTIPALPKGDGHTLEFYGRAYDMSSNYASGPRYDVDIVGTPPVITNITINPEIVTVDDDIVVTFYAEDNKGFKSAWVDYKDHTLWHDASATQINGTYNQGWFNATIPNISGGEGHTLRIIPKIRDVTGFVGEGAAYKVAIQASESSPIIRNVVISPETVTTNDDIFLSFEIWDPDGIAQVKIKYKDFVLWHETSATQTGKNETAYIYWYEATIPRIKDGGGHELRIKIEAKDGLGNWGYTVDFVKHIVDDNDFPSFLWIPVLFSLGIFAVIYRKKKD